MGTQRELIIFADTPWDEPTQGSQEFHDYVTGEAFNNVPWSRFSREVLCQ